MNYREKAAIKSEVIEAAEDGIRWEAKQQGLDLHSYDIRAMAANALYYALRSFGVITKEESDQRVKDEQEKTEQWKRNWAAVVNELDRLRRGEGMNPTENDLRRAEEIKQTIQEEAEALNCLLDSAEE